MEKRKINFLLYGESSFLNRGCQAIVNTTIKKIKSKCDGEIILSTNDLNDKDTYNNIITKYVKGYYNIDELSKEEQEKIDFFKTIPFRYENFEEIYEKDCIKEIENVDICLSIGGDNYCYGEPNWLYTINKAIKRKNKKNVFWCTSMFEKIESDEMIRDLKTFDIIVARETLTYNALKQYINEENLILSPDTAFSLNTKEVDLPNIFKENKKIVGINISPLISKYTQSENNILQSIKKLIEYILEKTDYNIALIPHVYMKGNNDLDSLNIVKNEFINEERIAVLDKKIYDCEELKYIISKCNYLIAARTHASIAGYSSFVPTLVIGYSIKSKGIATDLFGNYENYVIPVDKLSPENLLEKYNFLVDNEENIKNILKEKVPIYVQNSNNLLDEILTRLSEKDKINVTDNSKCTGCMACFNCCPNDAIEVIKNKEGFLYTKKNKEKCTECGLCKKICPANIEYDYKGLQECYAAINKNEEERISSSSGGMFSLIARKILDENGVIYGAALDYTKVKHIRIDSIKELNRLQGSKYVQSEIGAILKSVKDDLVQDKKVLFVGTSCQIEGLKSYLKNDYKNLICISIICHGVPSEKVFEKFIEEKEKKEQNNINSVNFRNKKTGWHNYSVEYDMGSLKQIIKYTDDPYMKAFLNDFCLRESCYNCQMRINNKNTSDIILGDFWGIENIYPELDDNKGVSSVIINTNKGKDIFEDIKNDIKYKEVHIEDITRFNPSLINSPKYTKKRDEFFKCIDNNEIEVVIQAMEDENNKIKIEENEQKQKVLLDEIKELNKYVQDLLEAKEYFLRQLEEKDKRIIQIENEKKEINNKLKNIYYSKTWKVSSKLAQIINKMRGKN